MDIAELGRNWDEFAKNDPFWAILTSPHAKGNRWDREQFFATGVTEVTEILEYLQSGDSSELAPRLPCKGKSVRNRGVSQTMPFLVIPRSLLRGGFIPQGSASLGAARWTLAAVLVD